MDIYRKMTNQNIVYNMELNFEKFKLSFVLF